MSFVTILLNKLCPKTKKMFYILIVFCCFFTGDLWTWSGKNHQNKRKGKGRKVFYKTIIRGDENISVSVLVVHIPVL